MEKRCIKFIWNLSEWYGPLSVPHGKIQKHILNEASITNKCSGIAIREIAIHISCQIMNVFL